MALQDAERNFRMSVARVEVTKPCSRQICRRTAASVSENVGRCL